MFWIGLHLEGLTIKWAKISRIKKKIHIDLLRTSSSFEEGIPSFLQGDLEDRSYELISGLDSSDVLLRDVQLQLKDKRKILKSLPFQIESHLPYPHEEAVVSIQIEPSQTSKSSKVSFYATKKALLENHIECLKEKKADPDQVSCTPAALRRFAEHFFPHLTQTLLLHVGAKTSTIVALIQGKPSFSFSFSLGSESFFYAAQKEKEDLSTLDLLHLSPEKHPFLYQITLQAQKELDRAFSFLQKKGKDSWQDILITGNFSAFLQLKSFILKNLPETMQVHECQEETSYDATTLAAYAVPIGLALEGLLSNDETSVDFRQGLFAAPAVKIRSLKAFVSFSLSCLLLTSVSFFVSNQYIKKQKSSLIEKLSSSFTLKENSIETLEELDFQISSLEVSSKKNKTPYLLSLSIPNVSEVLAWLSTHPLLLQEADLKKISYKLIKHPKLKTPSTPYLAKVELEIEIPNNQTAKEFKESLSQKTSLADTKKEFSWKTQGSVHFISFFLKPYSENNL